MKDRLLPAAQMYTAAGIRVFLLWGVRNGVCLCPAGKNCQSPGKHPHATAPHGCKDATTDYETVSRWCKSAPDSNIAIATGAESGLIVLDVDGPEGRASLAGREIPPTATAQTAKGWHYYFHHPGGVVPNSVRRIAPGLDVRGDGGYCVAPPSRHVSGHVYRWEARVTDSVALPPDWLVEAIRNKTGEKRAVALPAAIPEGRRHDVLIRKLACSLRGQGFEYDEILAAVQVANRRCQPPLPDSELERQVRDVVNRYPRTPRVRSRIRYGYRRAEPPEWALRVIEASRRGEPLPPDPLDHQIEAYCRAIQPPPAAPLVDEEDPLAGCEDPPPGVPESLRDLDELLKSFEGRHPQPVPEPPLPQDAAAVVLAACELLGSKRYPADVRPLLIVDTAHFLRVNIAAALEGSNSQRISAIDRLRRLVEHLDGQLKTGGFERGGGS